MRKFLTSGCLAVAVLLATGCNRSDGEQAQGNSIGNGSAGATAGGGIEEMGPMGGGGGNLTTDPAAGTDGTGAGGAMGNGSSNMSTGVTGAGTDGTGTGSTGAGAGAGGGTGGTTPGG